jgi:hypothetical protein
MVLPKGGSHYEQFVIVQRKEDRISKRKKKEKGQTTLPLNTSTFSETGLFCQQTGLYKLRGTLIEVPLQLTLTVSVYK